MLKVPAPSPPVPHVVQDAVAAGFPMDHVLAQHARGRGQLRRRFPFIRKAINSAAASASAISPSTSARTSAAIAASGRSRRDNSAVSVSL